MEGGREGGNNTIHPKVSKLSSRTPDSQLRELGFESPLLPFQSLSTFVKEGGREGGEGEGGREGGNNISQSVIEAQRWNAGLAIERPRVRITFATVKKFEHFLSLHDAPVHSAV